MKEKKQKRNKISLWAAMCALCVMIMASVAGCGNTSSRTEDSTSSYAAYGDTGFSVQPEEESYELATAEAGSSDSSVLSETDVSGDEYGTKLIRTVDLNLETTEFDSLLDTIRDRTEEMGGYVESSDVSTPGENENRYAYMTIRIPEDRLDEFLDMVGENANVTYTSEGVEDVTLRYVDLETHVGELRTEQETLQSMLEEAESVDEILAIQSQLTEVRYEIESYESQLKVLENRVSYSTVYLNISEVNRETPASSNSFGESVSTRFSDSIYRLGQGLRNFAIGFLGLLPIILLWVVIAVVALLIVLGCVRHRRKKKRGKTQDDGPDEPDETEEP